MPRSDRNEIEAIRRGHRLRTTALAAVAALVSSFFIASGARMIVDAPNLAEMIHGLSWLAFAAALWFGWRAALGAWSLLKYAERTDRTQSEWRTEMAGPDSD